MKNLWLTLFLILSLNTPQYGQGLPALEEVVEAFFNEYRYPTRLGPLLRFERKPDGYYVVRLEYDQSIKARLKFYDRQSASYLLLNSTDLYVDWEGKTTPRSTETGKRRAENYLRSLPKYDLGAFERQPYYGYRGWYNDAIPHFEALTQLDNQQLHALARAYSTAATSLVVDYNNYGLEQDRFQLQQECPAMDSIQLKQYLEAAEKCLAAYADLKTRDPDFPTPIGPAKTKYANERMHLFNTLLTFQGELIARKVLEEGLYESYFLIQARNYLNSCPPNAILVTYGDSDSFPFWYLQATTGFREDVIVTNISLLNTERYRQMVLKGPFGAASLQQGLPDFYQQPPTKIWARTTQEESPLPYQQLLQELTDQSSYQKTDNNWLFPLSSKRIEVTPPKNIPYLYPEKEHSPFYWYPFEGYNYGLPSGYFLFDALIANQWQRRLCFLPTVNQRELMGWEKHLVWNGWVYMVVPDLLEDNHFADGILHHTPYTTTVWQDLIAYDTSTVINDIDKLPFYQHQIRAASLYLKQLLALDQQEEALAFSNQLLQRYPNEIHPWDQSWIELVKLSRESGAEKSATQILTTISKNVEENRINFSSEEQRWLLLERVREMKE